MAHSSTTHDPASHGGAVHSRHGQRHGHIQANQAWSHKVHYPHVRMDVAFETIAVRDLRAATPAAEVAIDPSDRQCLYCGSGCNCSDACIGACHLVGLGYADVALSYAGGARVVLLARAAALRPWSTRPRLPPPRA